ncbi:hypothetical protein Droror1_Dr00008304 [Drosera rotundifolia]
MSILLICLLLVSLLLFLMNYMAEILFKNLLLFDLIKSMHTKLPVRRYERDPGNHGEEADMCVVCLYEIKQGSEIRELRCKHIFHKVCLDGWAGGGVGRATCPLCRGPLARPVKMSETGTLCVATFS